MDNRFMNLGSTAQFSSFGRWTNVKSGDECSTDTTLRLNSPGISCSHSSISNGTKRKLSENDFLAVGLRRSSSSSNMSKFSIKETDDESSVNLGLSFQLHIESESMTMSKPTASLPKNEPLPDLNLSLLTESPEFVIVDTIPVSAQHCNNLKMSAMDSVVPSMCYGSLTSFWNFQSYLNSPCDSLEASSGFPLERKVPIRPDPVSIVPNLTSMTRQAVKSPVISTSGVTHPQQRNNSTKKCQLQGCDRGARGASGLCIAHGGGRRCQKVGCHKGAEGRTIYCKAHGGGRRCQYLGCMKSADGRYDYCIAHGGGRRCSHESCTRAARGKSGLCIRHGGGKRCQRENCRKSAEGHSGLCISHGGGKRCQFPACTKGAQGSTLFCKAHGGGKRCTSLGCTKGAEGSTLFCKAHGGGKRCYFPSCPKSVHGGTLFCVAHGGGKRCAAPECTKSARGRTNFCVRHGGGKRCKFEGCGKSTQGSTDFCKAHGGGKRCLWGQPGSNFGVVDPPCERFVRGKSGLCSAHSALIQDRCVHGGGTLVLPDTGMQTPNNLNKSVKLDVYTDIFPKMEAGGERSMAWSCFEPEKLTASTSVVPGYSLISAQEGRVHGGSLMALLVSNAGPISSRAHPMEADI